VLGDDVAFAGVAGQVELVRRGDVSVRELVELTGAIIIGKTKMPELGLWPFTESVTWGVTRNPWNLERTPGGSSGGSAAVVAAGLVPAALGADGAGSIRIPAACCGVFGLKPQRGRVSLAPHYGDGAHWVVFGALTRSVLDSGVLLDVLSAQEGGFTQAAQTPSGRVRIAVARDFPTGSEAGCRMTRAQRLTRRPIFCDRSGTRSSSASSTCAPATCRSSSASCFG
jgi:amidase